MGRPIKSKFFGNTNSGTTSSSDNKIGGEGVASLSVSNFGQFLINATTPAPTVTVAVPEIPTGVRATVSIVWEVDSIIPTNGLAGHSYTTTTGGATTLTGLAGVTANITAVGSGQGEVQIIVPVNRGTFTTVPTAEVTYQIVGGDGNQQASVYYKIKSITVNEKGSGYRSAPAITFAGGTGTTAVVTTALTSSQQNALDFTAWIKGGSSAKVGDIINQVANTAYRVRTADGIGRAQLVADTPAEGQMTLIASDSSGATYYVTCLNERTARLVRKTGSSPEFATGTYVPWTFGSAVEDYSVSVANK